MVRKIIHIDEDKCTGCGICVLACHEGAIDIIDGKAKLVRENFCDGFGDCLPACPTGAITFEEREAPEYDEAAVKEAMKQRKSVTEHIIDSTGGAAAHLHEHGGHPAGCPGARFGELHREEPPMPAGCPGSRFAALHGEDDAQNAPPVPQTPGFAAAPVSQLRQWPCQIKLLPVKMPLYDGAKLLIAADCTAYAYANLHEEFMRGKVTMIGCPKLDDIDYTEKLTAILSQNDIKSVTVVRMEVPCCGGLEMAAKNALQASGKFIPWQVVTISTDGKILDS